MAVVMKEWVQEIKKPIPVDELAKLASHEEVEKKPDFSDKRLLTVSEFAQYLGIGKTTARAILKNTRLGYRVKINNTIMINKKLLDEYLDKKSF